METIENLNKLNEKTNKLERLCSKLLSEIDNNMQFNNNCSFHEKNSTKFTISAIRNELERLKRQHLLD